MAERLNAPSLYLGERLVRSVRPTRTGPAIICYYPVMKKKVVVEKEKFDAVLSQFLKSDPAPRKAIKTRGKRGLSPRYFRRQNLER